MSTTTYAAREVIERVWDAPIELVWELLTTAAGVEAWYGPRGFRADVQRLDVVPGGAFDFRMTAVGEDQVARMQAMGRPLSWPNRATFTEVVPHERLAYVSVIEMGPGAPSVRLLHTFELRASAEGVHMVLTLDADSLEMLRPAAGAWPSSLERLAAAIAERRSR